MQSMQSLCVMISATEITRLENQNMIVKCLAELNALTLPGRREKVERQLVRGIIGLKRRLGMGILSSQLANEVHKPVRKRFQKRSVFA